MASAIEIVVPTLGESVTEATVAKWLKGEGDQVEKDEPVVELETDKVTLEVNAASPGVISEIRVPAGQNVGVGAVLGVIGEGKGAVPAKKPANSDAKASAPAAAPALAPAPAAIPAAQASAPSRLAPALATVTSGAAEAPPLSPAVRKLVEDHNLNPAAIPASGKDGRLLKEDILSYLEKGGGKQASGPAASASTPARMPAPSSAAVPAAASAVPAGPRLRADREERVRMTRLRQRIAQRLKEAQNTAAMLTTFNEIDMSHVMALRAQYKDSFEKKHGVKLGFMSFFVKAAIQALRDFPAVNAEIEGDDVVYKNYYDIGVAVSTPNGLVVPVLRDADRKNFAVIEAEIADMGKRAREGGLALEELTGGTFTITNGGIFGSLMSTPILNPPQSGILGMHKIQERPVVVDGQVAVRPMMYVALSYDHRIIDGREAVSFLVRIKDAIEDPQRLLLDL